MTAIPLPLFDTVAERDARHPHCEGSPIQCGTCARFDDAGVIGAPGDCNAGAGLRDRWDVCDRPADYQLDTRTPEEAYPDYPPEYLANASSRMLGNGRKRRPVSASELGEGGANVAAVIGGLVFTFNTGRAVADTDYGDTEEPKA